MLTGNENNSSNNQASSSSSSRVARRTLASGSCAKWRLLALTLFGAILGTCLALGPTGGEARVTFEKMTNRDYSGLTYYTIQNVSLFECLGWCKEETSCTSAVFSFVVNPFAALQETTCMLQNETQARQTAYLRLMPGGDQVTVVAHPQKATNLYFFNKIELQTENVCSRLWAFERFPNRKLRHRDRQAFHAPNKEACQAACMNEQRFVCRSLEYNYINQQCTLNGFDRRSPLILHLAQQAASNQLHQHHQQQQSSLASSSSSSSVSSSSSSANNLDLVEAPGTDYFENACLLGEDICNESRIYDYAKIGLPLHRVAHFVELNYYPDKEMLVKSQAGCVRACTIEHEFICRSILYRSSFKQGQPNCALYHLDQKTFPEGGDTFMGHVMQPLLDSGETSAVYLEAVCNDTIQITNQIGLERGGGGGGTTTITMPPTSITIMPSSTTPGAISVHSNQGANSNNNGHNNAHNHHHLSSNHSSSASSSAASMASSSSSSSSASAASTSSQMMSSQASTSSMSSIADSERFIASTSTLSPLGSMPTSAASSTTIRLPTTFLPPANINLGGATLGPSGQIIPSNIQISGAGGHSGRPLPPGQITIGGGGGIGGIGGPSRGNNQQGNSQVTLPSHIMIGPAPPPPPMLPSRESQLMHQLEQSGSINPPGSLQISASGSGVTNHDQNCDAHGFCYDVALKCTDTKMVVNVKTQRPFFGRIYALGRSETCNANIKNQNQFQLDMYLTGQECNTQSAVSVQMREMCCLKSQFCVRVCASGCVSRGRVYSGRARGRVTTCQSNLVQI